MHGKGSNGEVFRRPLNPTGSVQRRRTTPPVFPSKSCFLGFLPTKFPEYPKKKASEVSRARKVRSIERLTLDYFLRIGGELSEPLKIAQLWELYWEGRINDARAVLDGRP